VTNIRLGLAHPDEAPAIANMSRYLIEQGLPWSWNEQRIGYCMKNRDCIVLAARDRRRLVGFAIMEFFDEHAHLSLLAVQPGYQRLGVGRQLIEWLESSARVAGTFTVQLELRVSNDGGRRFYERLGYNEVARKPAYYAGREDALRMVRQLAVATSQSTPP
jgi:ribosomal-protein-alanine acetyltransferase